MCPKCQQSKSRDQGSTLSLPADATALLDPDSLNLSGRLLLAGLMSSGHGCPMCSCPMPMGTSLALSWDLQGSGRCGCRKVSRGVVVHAYHSAPPLQPAA